MDDPEKMLTDLVSRCEALARQKRLDELDHLIVGSLPFLDVTTKQQMVDTLFHVALHCGKTELAIAAIELGMDVNYLEGGFTPLSQAISEDQEDCPVIVLKLLEKGANPDTRLIFDYTALHFAVLKRKHELARALLTHGAEVNAITNMDSFETPLMIAARRADRSMVQLLLDHGANPWITNCLGDSALTLAPTEFRKELEHQFEKCGRVMGAKLKSQDDQKDNLVD